MIGSAEAAAEFVEKISGAAEARMRRDHAQLLARKRKDVPGAERVEPWDSAWLQERVKAEEYDFDSQSVRPYFEYRRVKEGVLDVTARLFGIGYRRVDAPVWHPEVEVYDVVEGEALLGRIYLDMHPRDGKYKHYAQFTLAVGAGGRAAPGGRPRLQLPAPGAGRARAHGARGREDVLPRVRPPAPPRPRRPHALGGSVRRRDRVGLRRGAVADARGVGLGSGGARRPSRATSRPASRSRRRSCGRMKAADEYGKGLMVRQQMFYAATSLELHRRDPTALDTTALVAEMQERYTPFRHVEGTYFHESFGHLDGYSAIYYTYMWSLVIAKDLFGPFREAGLMSPEPARRYRKAILEAGGSKPAAELVKDFLGRPHAFEAYEAWLNSEVG